ncbi:MAG TPA: U32 family peptidase [Rhodocyclaceae bacterium]|nr:U32 family peptidase [Rhodocyclaceae bacterium]
MTSLRNHLELLAPAKNADFGIEAINHGADAVYIGGPAFGARTSAGNTVADIEKLAAHAHRYNARVLVALNTILKDEELEEARRIAWQVYEAGADAVIVQDMGLLEMDLPPMALHASTQTDNRSLEKVKFLEDVGFSQIVLARELSLPEIRKIAAGTTATLEFFIHGALCVAYSGQCYISHAHTGRSANRGECSQACRLPYDLADQDGQIIAQNSHLLSMKDNNQSANLRALVEAGISSFKIEGRLKDLSYVKNITAHYRLLLDEIIDGNPEYRRAASGRCTFSFTPQPEKTFNRGSTDYFVNDRKTDIGAFDSPKFVGEAIGTVTRVARDHFEVETTAQLNNGDGVSYYDADHELVGLRINRAEGGKLFPAEMPADLKPGLPIYRNRDQEFERALEKKSAERRIGVRMTLTETADGFVLTVTDEDGNQASAALAHAKEPAANPGKALATIRENLGKLGNTLFSAEAIELFIALPWFLPASALNALRREAVDKLEAVRRNAYQRPQRWPTAEPPAPFPASELTYLGNVYNQKARDFYTRHGVSLIEDAYEANREKGAVSLMITKHCLRYSFNLCPKQVKGIRPEPMALVRGGEKLTLRFDCKRCEMHVVGKLRKNFRIQL